MAYTLIGQVYMNNKEDTVRYTIQSLKSTTVSGAEYKIKVLVCLMTFLKDCRICIILL